MIGQKNIQDKLNNYKELPNFMIFEGSKGCGKKTLAKELSSKYNLNYILIGIKLANIEDMINLANNTTNNLFFIDNGNDLSPSCENTLLKITEDLPNNNHIILACEYSILLLPTIISRGELFRFEDYKEEDFKKYLKESYKSNINYSFIYPNLSYLNDRNEINDYKLYELCKNFITFDNKNEKMIFNLMNKVNDFNFTQFLYCLEKISYDKMLTSITYNDKIIIIKLATIIKIISKVRQMLVESLVYNRSYIIDYMTLRIIEVYKQ